MRFPWTNNPRNGGKPTKLQKLVKLTVHLGAITLSLAAIATKITLPHGTLSELTHIEAFTQAYPSVNCNAPLLANTQTIRVTGHMMNGDNRQAFSLIKKRLDRMLFTVDRGSHEMTFGVSGDSAWRRIRAPQHSMPACPRNSLICLNR